MVEPTAEGLGIDRRRAVWWVVGGALALVVGLVVRAFVGTFVFGLFVYYAIRPIDRRFRPYADSRVEATTATMVVAALPLLVVLVYGGTLLVDELLATLGTETAQMVLARFVDNPTAVTAVADDPSQVASQIDGVVRLGRRVSSVLGPIGFVGGALLRLSLALALTFFLLQDGHRVEEWFRSEVAAGDSTAYVFLRGIDADLETVYFGNVLTVVGVTVASVVGYNAYNLLAPAAVSLPVPTLLGVATGLATFVPLVVGKLVYLPATALLVWNAVQADAWLGYPIAFLVGAFVFLDIVPQTLLRPLISGRSLHSGLVLFGYVLGTSYFGWYGLFLGPLLVVAGVQFLKHVLPDLATGDAFVPETDEGVEIGTDPLEDGGLPAEYTDETEHGTVGTTDGDDDTGRGDGGTSSSDAASGTDGTDAGDPSGVD
ncbi:AI-2E family transporter [Halobaculum sp. MBLA0147]|uniref:AI-2E family transporter n=1 Tax=Halobaculum sp. MBLA0147 TaxID=3079934 RepID=UPI003525B310